LLDVGRHWVEVVSGRPAPARLAFVEKAVIAQVVSFLRIHRCDEIQVYYFSKPLAVKDVATKLRATNVYALATQLGGLRD
jgi:hypothetical protein